LNFSLTPGFSPVPPAAKTKTVSTVSPARKAVETAGRWCRFFHTRLKPGVNEIRKTRPIVRHQQAQMAFGGKLFGKNFLAGLPAKISAIFSMRA
jgi:hypothetical protein